MAILAQVPVVRIPISSLLNPKSSKTESNNQSIGMDEYTPLTFRLYPNVHQETLFHKTAGCCRFLYNETLDRCIRYYNTYKVSPDFLEIIKQIPKLKIKYDWLKEVDATALQQVLRNLKQAYANFFCRVKSGEKPGFPKFKSKHGSKASFRCTMSNKIDSALHTVKIGKCGYIKARGNFDGYNGQHIVNVTVSKDSNNCWYASVLIKQSQLVYDHVFKRDAVGIDIGVVQPLTLADSDGRTCHTGTAFKERLAKKESRRKHYQRCYARKVKGSNNQHKAKLKVGFAYYKEKQCRKDYAEQVTKRIASTYEVVVVEDLRLNNMTKSAKGTIQSPGTNVAAKSGLNREMLRLGLGYILLRLSQKVTKYGGVFLRVNPKFTSQICSSCGHKDQSSRESQSRFKCTACGTRINADVNAAYNVLDRGLAILA